ncbi:unnamed protein product [marine sediment metagenome]|uniref:Uncharacterized protein n=1 Tax=marine sediment metagenome TaxID=412755 RepID=X1BT53_9ZZZZ
MTIKGNEPKIERAEIYYNAHCLDGDGNEIHEFNEFSNCAKAKHLKNHSPLLEAF